MRRLGLLITMTVCGIGLGLFLSSRSWAGSPCPKIDAEETPEDCPWARIARDLIQETERGRPVLPKLKKEAAGLVQKMKVDARNPHLLGFWGQSLNYDELVKAITVHPSILGALSQIFRIPKPKDLKMHAGIEHTYGYLFSVLKTPFGYKRARWVRPSIEMGFGIPRGLLGPLPKKGTLLSNLTYLAGKIAFREDPEKLGLLSKELSSVPKELVDLPYASFKTVRIEEKVRAKNVEGKTREIALRTDLISYLQLADKTSANSHLLVYSVVDPLDGGARLITAFPVEEGFVQTVVKNGRDQGKPITTRYNAYVDGVTGNSLQGNRAVTGGSS